MIFTFDNINNDKMQHLFMVAADHYAETLKIRKDLRANLIINIEYNQEMDEDDCGFCVWEDRRRKPREFTIELDGKRTVEDQLQDLAHEMVHVKQFAKGDLVDLQSGGWEFKGKEHKLTGDKWSDYWFNEWEMEARAMERPMYMKFMEDFDPEHEAASMFEIA